MAVHGCVITSWPIFVNPAALTEPVSNNAARMCNIPGLASSVALTKPRSSYVVIQKVKISPAKCFRSAAWCVNNHSVAASTTPFLCNPLLPKKKRVVIIPKASTQGGSVFNFRYPAMTKKPRWWWRFLACLPYLMPIHETWIFAETAFHISPFLENLEHVTMPFFEGLSRFPEWCFFLYFICAYLFVVRRKEWPHFLRFHIVMGMLLEIGFQAMGLLWDALPEGLYWGKIGAHFWYVFSMAHLLTCVMCAWYAVRGMYADVPLISDAAYIQMPYD
ncbi:hypothetical protein Dimus_019088 [Dionaea muscipula]